MKKLMFVLLIIFFIGCDEGNNNFQQVASQAVSNNKIINGYVIDDPIVGATIEVYDENGTLVKRKENATDKNGYFSLEVKNLSNKYMIRATNGKIKGKPFYDTLYSICFENQCNVTPVTTIIALEFNKNIKNITKQDVQKFVQQTLGISDYQSINLQQIKNISKYAQSNDMDIDSITAIIANDISDGYADDNITKQLFPTAQIRQTIQKQFKVDLVDIDNYQNRNLKILNLRTGEKVDINQPINYQDYKLNIALVEDYNYTLYDGTEQNETNIIYLPFKAYSDNKLDINSTIYYYLFFDPKLANLPETAKESLINIINTKYVSLVNNLRKTYKNYVNYGIVYKSQLDSQINFLQEQLIKNELTTYQTIQNTQQTTKIFSKIITSQKTDLQNKNYFNLGGLKLIHDIDDNKTYVRNILPLYLGFADKFQFETIVNDGYYNWFSLDSILDSFHHTLIDKNVGGGIGLLTSYLVSSSIEQFSGKKTDLSIQGNNTYIFYKSPYITSISSILNYLDIVSSVLQFRLDTEKIRKIVQNTSNIYSKMYTGTKKAFDLISTGLSITDCFFSVSDILSDEDTLKFFGIKYNKEELNQFRETLKLFKEDVSSLNKIVTEIKNLINGLIKIPPEPKSFSDIALDEVNMSKTFQTFLKKTFKIPYQLYDFTKIGKIPTYDEKSHFSLLGAAFIMFFTEDKNYKDYFEKNLKNYPDKNNQSAYFNTDKLSVAMYIIFNALKAKKIDQIDNYAKTLYEKGYLVIPGKLSNKVIDRFDIYKATLNTMKYFYKLNSKQKRSVFDYVWNFKSSMNYFLNNIQSEVNFIRWLSDFYLKVKKTFSKNSIGEALWQLFIKPSLLKSVDNGEDIIKDKIINLLKTNPYGKIITLVNEAGGKIVSFLMFPNKITFKAKVDDSGRNIYFSSAIDGITPIAFEKGINLPQETSKQYSILKRPTTNSFYGLIVADENNASWYRPYFETIFKESAYDVRRELNNIDENTFAKVEWEYKKCPYESINGQFSLNEELCQNFNNNYLSYTIKGDDIDGGEGGDKYLGYHDKFILPYPDKNGNIKSNGSYFDFFDYLAVKFSNGLIDAPWGPGLKDSQFAIYNKTRGIYLDKISAKYYGFDEDSKFSSPEAKDIIFKIESAKNFDFDVDVNNTDLTIINNSNIDLTFLIIKTQDLYSSNPSIPFYSFSIPYSSDENEMKKTIPISELYSDFNTSNLTIIAVDSILKDYAKYVGMDNLLSVIYSLYDPYRFKNVSEFLKAYTYNDSYNQSVYPFMRSKNIEISSNNPPYIDNFNIDQNGSKIILSINATDPDNNNIICHVDWGDGNTEDFDCDTNISHSYIDGGEYNLTVKAIDDKGFYDELSLIIKIEDINNSSDINNTVDVNDSTDINYTIDNNSLIGWFDFENGFSNKAENNETLLNISNINNVIIENGYLKLINNYDYDPRRYVSFTIDTTSTKVLVIEKKTKLTTLDNYTLSQSSFVNSLNENISIIYNNYHYNNGDLSHQINVNNSVHFYIENIWDYNDSNNFNYQLSSLLEPIWNEWFFEKIIINYEDNLAIYGISMDNINYKYVTLNNMKFTRDKNTTFTLSAWDWASGSEHDVDELKIYNVR